jgi:3-oxoacyl-[acyl-carrier protein] reductase
MMQLTDKIAIVTGAGNGFGAGIAQAYAAEGARVVLADLNLKNAQAVAEDLGTGTSTFQCDVAEGLQVSALVEHCVSTFGVPDIVVNNAGTTHPNGSLLEVSEATFDRIFAVNVKSIFHMARAVIPLMRQRKYGVILNIASTAGMRPRPGLVWYSGTKGAVNTISKGMALELAEDNIRVNAISPVMGETGLIADFMGQDTPENRAKFKASIPLGRFSQPRDIANAAIFLASDAADLITGIDFPVDGGRTA